MKISVGEKVLWKYVLYYLNNKNCCLNNTTKQTLNFHHSKPKFHEPHIRFSYLAWFFFSVLITDYSKKWVTIMKTKNRLRFHFMVDNNLAKTLSHFAPMHP